MIPCYPHLFFINSAVFAWGGGYIGRRLYREEAR
jgi:hypothetical protein